MGQAVCTWAERPIDIIAMREKIADYLKKNGRPVPADQILRDVLRIFSPNSLTADTVLKGILKGDARFRRSTSGWILVARMNGLRALEIAALYLEEGTCNPTYCRGAIHIPKHNSSREFRRTADSEDIPSGEARIEAENHLLVVWKRRELLAWNRFLRSLRLAEWTGDSVVVSGLAARVLSGLPPRLGLEDLASRLQLPPPDTENMPSMARFLASAYQCLIERVPADRRGNADDLNRWIAAGAVKVDFSRFAFGRDFLAGIPESPGVYLMRDRAGEVIYVGKSHNLRRRLRSYFTPRALKDAKVARIHTQLYSLEHILCATEVEALLLEMRMIRDFRPAINLQCEIHEQPARYGKGSNLLLLVPAGQKVEIYLLRDGIFAARQSVATGLIPPKRLRERIQRLYFELRSRRRMPIEDWEIEIVARWLRARRKRLNIVDVDEAGSCESVLKRLTSYLKDPERLAAKVYYR